MAVLHVTSVLFALFVAPTFACTDTILKNIGLSTYSFVVQKNIADQGEHTLMYYTKASPSTANRTCITFTVDATTLKKHLKFFNTDGSPEKKDVDLTFRDDSKSLFETWSNKEKYFEYIVYFQSNVLAVIACANNQSYPMWVGVSAATKAKTTTNADVAAASNKLKGWGIKLGTKFNFC